MKISWQKTLALFCSFILAGCASAPAENGDFSLKKNSITRLGSDKPLIYHTNETDITVSSGESKIGKDYFPVQEGNPYSLFFDYRGSGAEFRVSFDCLTSDKKLIAPVNVLYRNFTQTTLARPCSKSDTVIFVNAARELWQPTAKSAVAFDVKNDLSDLPNFNVSSPGITAVEKAGNAYKVTLAAPCGFDYPAGTAVRLHSVRDLVSEFTIKAEDKNIRHSMLNIVIPQNYRAFWYSCTRNYLYPGTRFIRLRITAAPGSGKNVVLSNIRLEKSRFVLRRTHNSVISDGSSDYRLSPNTIVHLKNGDILAGYVDRGDCGGGCTQYIVRSKDQGKTWSKPEKLFEPDSLIWGYSAIIVRMPDDRLLAALTRAHHKRIPKDAFSDAHKNRLRDYLDVHLYVGDENGENWKFLQSVSDVRYRTLTGAGNEVVVLPNGDWIFPVWAYGPQNDKNAPQGSGFIRSTDKGKTWGKPEMAFPYNPPKSFNESAYTVTPDGNLVGVARFDNGPKKTHFMHRVISKDNGKTWSKPEAITSMLPMWPAITKLDNGIYVMLYGNKVQFYNSYEPCLHLSTDGVNWENMGAVYFSRPAGWFGEQDVHYWGTGSSQSLTKVPGGAFYCIFEGADGGLQKSQHPFGRRYIDFNSYVADFAD